MGRARAPHAPVAPLRRAHLLAPHPHPRLFRPAAARGAALRLLMDSRAASSPRSTSRACSSWWSPRRPPTPGEAAHGRDDAAMIAALAFTFSGYALAHWGHPQLQLLGMLPLGFLVLFRLLDAPTTRNAAVCGAVTAAIALGALYYGALFAFCAVAVVLGHLWSQRYRLKEGLWRGIAIAVVVAGVLVAAVRRGLRAPSVPARVRSAVGSRVGPQGRGSPHSGASQLPLRLDGAHRARARRRAHAFRGASRDGPRRRRSGLGAATAATVTRGATTCTRAKNPSPHAATASSVCSCSRARCRSSSRSGPRSSA